MVVQLKDMYEWDKCFIIFPVVTIDNKLVFLQKVMRKWNPEKNGFADSSGYCGYDGGWDYKL